MDDDLIRLHDLIDAAKPDDVADALKEALMSIDEAMNRVGPNWRDTMDRIERVLKGGK